MNWIKFTIWLCGSYLIYYAAIILWDTMRAGRLAVKEEQHELSFIDPVESQHPELVKPAKTIGAAVTSSGGVSLKQLFNLAQQEAIEFTRPVSF